MSPDDPFYDLALLLAFPEIPWFQPIKVTIRDYGSTGFGCRLCIGRYGLAGPTIKRKGHMSRALDIHEFPTSQAAFYCHLAEKHHFSLG